jgi:hypothetical protein
MQGWRLFGLELRADLQLSRRMIARWCEGNVVRREYEVVRTG